VLLRGHFEEEDCKKLITSFTDYVPRNYFHFGINFSFPCD
jgi:hypothetical protein